LGGLFSPYIECCHIPPAITFGDFVIELLQCAVDHSVMPLNCREYIALSSDETVINGNWEKYGKFVLWSILRYYPDICDTGLRKIKEASDRKAIL
jgi:hypothetical protein